MDMVKEHSRIEERTREGDEEGQRLPAVHRVRAANFLQGLCEFKTSLSTCPEGARYQKVKHASSDQKKSPEDGTFDDMFSIARPSRI
jgi:hypothetical protein